MIEFEGSRLTINGKVVELDYPIYDAFELTGKVIVLYRPESYKGGGQFPNLVSLSNAGEILWKAELPTNNGMDAYYGIVSQSPLVADSYCSYRCEIDPETGKILSREFYK